MFSRYVSHITAQQWVQWTLAGKRRRQWADLTDLATRIGVSPSYCEEKLALVGLIDQQMVKFAWDRARLAENVGDRRSHLIWGLTWMRALRNHTDSADEIANLTELIDRGTLEAVGIAMHG